LIGLVVVVLFFCVTYVIFGSGLQKETTSSSTNQNNIASNGKIQGEIQEIKLGFGPNGYYIPREITVKVGSTVRLIGDTNTLVGCMKTVIIHGYNVKKRMLPGDNILEFVADRPGVYPISCPMGMGSGKLIVTDQYGNFPNSWSQSGQQYKPSVQGCGCGS
jgi:plastocyanin domain-containing protein